MTDSIILSLHNIRYRIAKKEILHSVSLTVKRGESVAILGRSGSGKSTLLSIALGMLKPSSGQVTVGNTKLSELGREALTAYRSKHIGMVFQHAELLPELSAVENVALPGLLRDNPADGIMQRAARLLIELEVPQETLAIDLSGGEQQRTALARALINSPELILADEPTGSLDAELRDSAAQRLFGITTQTGCGLVVVTHDPVVAECADRVLILREGELFLG